jgi:hypothetical protein
MPVILATQEAEIRRIEVQSQPRQILLNTLARKSPSHTKKRAAEEPLAVGQIQLFAKIAVTND